MVVEIGAVGLKRFFLKEGNGLINVGRDISWIIITRSSVLMKVYSAVHVVFREGNKFIYLV